MRLRATLPFALTLAAVTTVSSFAPTEAAACGKASWYALDGRTTANGEIMSSKAMTAAHKSLPFGTRVRVTNRNNGKSITVRINDRGPFIAGRVIDVTRGVARRLGFNGKGVVPVSLKIVSKPRKGGSLCS